MPPPKRTSNAGRIIKMKGKKAPPRDTYKRDLTAYKKIISDGFSMSVDPTSFTYPSF